MGCDIQCLYYSQSDEVSHDLDTRNKPPQNKSDPATRPDVGKTSSGCAMANLFYPEMCLLSAFTRMLRSCVLKACHLVAEVADVPKIGEAFVSTRKI